jgi:hypothetical protein
VGDLDFFVDNFQVRTPPTCPAPNALTATNATTVGADLDLDRERKCYGLGTSRSDLSASRLLAHQR